VSAKTTPDEPAPELTKTQKDEIEISLSACLPSFVKDSVSVSDRVGAILEKFADTDLVQYLLYAVFLGNISLIPKAKMSAGRQYLRSDPNSRAVRDNVYACVLSVGPSIEQRESGLLSSDRETAASRSPWRFMSSAVPSQHLSATDTAISAAFRLWGSFSCSRGPYAWRQRL
jgi:hypothetical protein